MDFALALMISQIPYYVILFFCIRELRKLRDLKLVF